MYDCAVIRGYVLGALAFVVKDIINEKLLFKMVNYSIDNRNIDSEETEQLKSDLKGASTMEEQKSIMINYCKAFENDMVSVFIKKVGILNG